MSISDADDNNLNIRDPNICHCWIVFCWSYCQFISRLALWSCQYSVFGWILHISSNRSCIISIEHGDLYYFGCIRPFSCTHRKIIESYSLWCECLLHSFSCFMFYLSSCSSNANDARICILPRWIIYILFIGRPFNIWVWLHLSFLLLLTIRRFATYTFGHGMLVCVMCTIGAVLIFRKSN